VHQAIQPPLRAHLLAPAQGEPIEPLVVPDVAKHRIHRADALAVALPSLGTVNALLHRLEHIMGTALVLLEDRHLPHRRALWVAQAQLPLSAWPAAALAAGVLVAASPVDRAGAAVAVELLTRRADAVALVIGHPEVLGPVQPDLLWRSRGLLLVQRIRLGFVFFLTFSALVALPGDCAPSLAAVALSRRNQPTSQRLVPNAVAWGALSMGMRRQQ
jgi:hypothetical protein